MAQGGKRKEKRTSKRITFRARVDYELESEDTFVFEHMANLSKGGIFLATRTPLAVGTTTTLRFDIPKGGRTVEVQGRVAWINEYRPGGENPNPGMGVEFVDLDEADRDVITRLVKRKAILPD